MNYKTKREDTPGTWFFLLAGISGILTFLHMFFSANHDIYTQIGMGASGIVMLFLYFYYTKERWFRSNNI